MFFPVEHDGRFIFLSAFDPAEFESEAYAQGLAEGKEYGQTAAYEQGLADGRLETAEDSRTLGKLEAEKVCEARHFTMVIVGTGGTSFSFNVPFEPDVISVAAIEMNAVESAGVDALLQLVICPTSDGFLAGSGTAVSATGTTYPMRYKKESMSERYSRSEDGMITFFNLAFGTSTTNPNYATLVNGRKYLISASRNA